MSILEAKDILKLLPHRYPMLMVDRVIECDDKEFIVAIKNVAANEPFLCGHFPGKPIMPGVLQIEAMAQTAGILLNRVLDLAGKIPYFLSIDRAKFRRPVVPGDQMRIEVRFLQRRSRTAKFEGRVLVAGELASEAEILCMITDEKSENK